MEHWRRYRQPQVYQEDAKLARRPFLRRLNFRFTIRFWIIFAVVFIFIVGGWLFGWSLVFVIKHVRVEGEVMPEVLKEINRLEGSRIFLVNERELMEKLKPIDPSLSSLRIAKGLPDQINLYLTRRHPTLIWQTTAGKWGIDQEGYVFPLDETTAEGVPQVIDQRNLPVPVGEKLLLESFIQFVLDGFKELPNRIGGQIVRAEVDETTFHVRFVTEWGWTIILASGRPIQGQLGSLDLVLKTHRDQIKSYLDLRLNGWAYLK